jgi:hypothetical protein
MQLRKCHEINEDIAGCNFHPALIISILRCVSPLRHDAGQLERFYFNDRSALE